MKIVDVSARIVSWPIAPPWAGWSRRRAVIVTVTTDTNLRGYGEAAPLPDRSPPGDDLSTALASIAALRTLLPLDFGHDGVPPFGHTTPPVAPEERRLALDLPQPRRSPRTTTPERWSDRAREIAGRIALSPSACFAIETALLDACAKACGVPLRVMVASEWASEVALCAVVEDEEGARRAIARGVTTIKVKGGERLREIRAVGDGIAIRVDANRAAVEVTGDVEFVEEPGGAVDGVAIALDETVAEIGDEVIERRLARGDVSAIVIKPALVDGVGRAMTLAAIAKRHGVGVVVSHALDGPIGMAACAELALAIGGDRAVGLDRHAGLDAWQTRVPQIGDAVITGSAAPGLGLDEAALEADLERLATPSEHEHEHEHGLGQGSTRAAIVDGDEQIDFATLARAARLIPDPGGAAVIVGEPTAATIVRIAAAIEARTPIVLLHPRLPAEQHARQLAAIHAIPDDTLAVVFTSGSTGEPRAVALSRDGALAAAEASARNLGWHDDDAWLLCLPLAHVAGLAIVVRCLLARRAIVVAPTESDAMIAAAIRARATLASWVPAQLAHVVERGGWPTLRAALIGGAATPLAMRERATARGIPILTTYGATELWGQIATQPLARAGRVDDGVGVPLWPVRAGTRAAPSAIVVDSPARSPYLDAPGDRGPLVTGDVGFVDDRGWLHVIGRRDDVIVTGGENVHPAQVEDVLASVPGIREVCVFARPDPQWGQRVCAAVAFAPGVSPSVLDDVMARLAPHQRPRELAIVDRLPRTASGKIDRRALA
jgi:O-succinylbenzoic acid--CoA ligase